MNDFGEHLELPTSPSVGDFLDDQSKETRANAEKGSSDDHLKLALLLLGIAD